MVATSLWRGEATHGMVKIRQMKCYNTEMGKHRAKSFKRMKSRDYKEMGLGMFPSLRYSPLSWETMRICEQVTHKLHFLK
jgi:hypothetical protein